MATEEAEAGSLWRDRTCYAARWVLAVLIVGAIVAFLITPWLVLVGLLFIVYTFALFRDPERVAPNDRALVVAAAEVAVGLAIIVAIFRRRQDVTADDVNALEG